MNELAIRTAELPTFTNKELNAATQKIVKISLKIKKNLYEVALILAKVAETKSYEDDGFKSAAEYAMKTFGFKKSAAYNLLTIGKEYTSPALESNLPHTQESDFSTTQIEKMLPLDSREIVVELIEAGTITPDMTCKEIEAVVKSINKKDEPETEETGKTEPVEMVESVYHVYVKSASMVTRLNDMTEHELYAMMETNGMVCCAAVESADDMKVFAEYADDVCVYILTKI